MLVVSKSCPFDPYKDSKENADASGVNFHAPTSAEWLDPRFPAKGFQCDATVPKVNCAARARRYAGCGAKRDFAGISVRMGLHRKMAALAFAAIACILWPAGMRGAPGTPADDAALAAAICPIVYPVDPSATDRGYHYLFYGNGFFINEQGYLITAAHVLSQLHGGQPYILLRPPSGPPRFVPANLVAVDRDHDVAILRATPNPFEGTYKVAF